MKRHKNLGPVAVRKENQEPTKEEVEKELQIYVRGDLAFFADGLYVARAYWRKYRNLVEADRMPRRLSKAFKDREKDYGLDDIHSPYLLPIYPPSPNVADMRKRHLVEAIEGAREKKKDGEPIGIDASLYTKAQDHPTSAGGQPNRRTVPDTISI